MCWVYRFTCMRTFAYRKNDVFGIDILNDYYDVTKKENNLKIKEK